MTHPTLAELLQPFYGLRQQGPAKAVTVLVIAWEPVDLAAPLTNVAALGQRIFGPGPSVADYFREASQGRFTILPAIPAQPIIGPFKSRQPSDFYGRQGRWAPPTNPADPHYYLDTTGDFSGKPNTPMYLDADGFVNGFQHSYKEAIEQAATLGGVNFKNLDRDGDGEYGPNDGAILIVKAGSPESGYRRGVEASQIPYTELRLNGTKVAQVTEVYADSRPTYSDAIMAVMIEELLHVLVDYLDQYPDAPTPGFRQPDDPRRPGQFSISDAGWRAVHVDPFCRLKWGWLRPQLVTQTGLYQLREAGLTGDALILSGSRGTREFFILENRFRGNSYDRFRAPGCRGSLAVWDCIQDPNITTDGLRRAIHLKRADPRLDAARNPQDQLALFAADPARSYRLFDDSFPQNLRFDDGAQSSLAVTLTSTDGPVITVSVEVGTIQRGNTGAAAWLNLLLAPEDGKGGQTSSVPAWLVLL